MNDYDLTNREFKTPFMKKLNKLQVNLKIQ